MGHRANFFVRHEGESLAWRGSALSIDQDLLLGPQYWSPGGDPEGKVRLHDEVYCEGSVVVDFDVKRLLWFGGMETDFSSPLLRGMMDVVRLTWPDWRVEWAARGATQVAAAAGFDPAPLVAPDLGPSQKKGKDTPKRALQVISQDLDAAYADGAEELPFYNTVGRSTTRS